MKVANEVNQHDAPVGYYAVHKPERSEQLPNICTQCDWRRECQKPKTDLENPKHRCMGFPIISAKTGTVIERADNCSVIFKKGSIG